MKRDFIKMQGAGNDFVIFDARTQPHEFSSEQIKAIADRRFGIGCDQVIVMEGPVLPSPLEGEGWVGGDPRSAGTSVTPHPNPPPREGRGHEADIFMRIYNADGGQVSSCGNATRCVAWLLMEETKKDRITLQTKAGILHAERKGPHSICVDMGEPKFAWNEIPLSEPRDTLHLGISLGDLSDPVAVSMGNPHAVFVAGDVARLRIRDIGPALEHYPIFPERANISFAQPITANKIKLRVWERGVGETLACGTAACATLVGLHRRGLADNAADIELPGGVLHVEWRKENNRVYMTGPVAVSFSGKVVL